MSNSEIREPKQQRSIEKKRRIVEAGFKLFGEKGYYNTNTAEIAKAAGVSTGIVYNYFKDKKDIFIEALKFFGESMITPLYNYLAALKQPLNLVELLNYLIDFCTHSHTLSRQANDEMMAMSYTDKEVREYFCYFEVSTANKIVEIMAQHGLKPTNAHEKVHIAMWMIESYCHEVNYHKHDYMNYEIMKQEIIQAIITMMSS